MKKLYTFLLACISLQMSAQFYGEWYFDADAEGWTASGDGVVFNWTQDGPAPTASIWAVPALLGTSSGGWMMLDDDADGFGINTNSYFESPVLDLSAAPAQLKLEFDQYFQEFEAGNDTTQVQVTSNGGLDWHTVTINDGVGRANRPNPEHVVINITPGILDDPSNVQIRFRYRADWSYGWQIDNVQITELADYDLVAWEAFTDYILTEYEYKRVPIDQTQDLETGVVVRNLGAQTLNSISANLTVTDPNGSDVVLDNSSGSLVELQSFEQDTIWIATGLTPDQVGFYTFTFDLTAAETDDDIALGDESATRLLEVTENTYSHTFTDALNYQANGREIDGVFNEYMMGNVFEIFTETDLLRVQCKLGDKTTPDQELDVWVYEWQDTDADGILIVNELTSYQYLHEITQADIDSPDYLSIELEDQITLSPGTYIIGLHSNGQGDQFWVESEFRDTDFSTVLWGDFNQTAADWWFGWAFSPSVRIETGTWVVGVSEYENDIFALEQNQPNPAQANTQIFFNLKEAGKTQFVMHDLTGRKVYEEEMGRLNSGRHSITMDVSDLNSGTYFYTVTVGTSSLTRKLTVN